MPCPYRQEEKHVDREKVDASQIYSQQRRSGNCFATGGEEHAFARCEYSAAELRFQSRAGGRSVLRGPRTFAQRHHGRKSWGAAARARHGCEREDLRADSERVARYLALRCRWSVFGLHEDQSWIWIGTRRPTAGTSAEWWPGWAWRTPVGRWTWWPADGRSWWNAAEAAYHRRSCFPARRADYGCAGDCRVQDHLSGALSRARESHSYEGACWRRSDEAGRGGLGACWCRGVCRGACGAYGAAVFF